MYPSNRPNGVNGSAGITPSHCHFSLNQANNYELNCFKIIAILSEGHPAEFHPAFRPSASAASSIPYIDRDNIVLSSHSCPELRKAAAIEHSAPVQLHAASCSAFARLTKDARANIVLAAGPAWDNVDPYRFRRADRRRQRGNRLPPPRFLASAIACDARVKLIGPLGSAV